MTAIYWMEQRACEVPDADDWLTPPEAAHQQTLRFPKRRQEWRLGRWTAKLAIAVHAGLPFTPETLGAIEIRPAPSGAPEAFIRGEPAPVSISLSHRAGRGLCAIAPAGTPIGCDLEMIETRPTEFVEDYFTAEEQALLRGTISFERDWLLALFWSAKESVLKALRTGLRASTKSVSVFPLLNGNSRWQPYCARTSSGAVFRGWSTEKEGLLRTFAVPR